MANGRRGTGMGDPSNKAAQDWARYYSDLRYTGPQRGGTYSTRPPSGRLGGPQMFGEEFGDTIRSDYDIRKGRAKREREAEERQNQGGTTTGVTDTTTGTTTGGGVGTHQAPPVRLRTVDELAKLWGMNVDQDYYKQLLDQATEARFAEMESGARQAQDRALRAGAQQYRLLAQQQDEARRNALRTGASQGVSAAQDIAGLIGAQQAGGQVQTQLAQALTNMGLQKGTMLEENLMRAQEQENMMRQYLGNVAQQLYMGDIQGRAADLGLMGELARANAQITSSDIAAGANERYTKYLLSLDPAVRAQLSGQQS